jgi:transposase, IS30 family
LPRKYRQLSEFDRFQIQFMLAQGVSQNLIAKRIEFSPSTVSNELSRTRAHFNHDSYFATQGQQLHDLNRKRGGALRRKLGQAFDSPMAKAALADLREGWSPQQVSGRIVQSNAAGAAPLRPTVSHETIYAAIYAQPRGSLRTELVKTLRKSRAGRLPRARGKARYNAVQDMVSIALRPLEVAARIVPGHWEGDLIKGARNASAVGTLVERTSRRIMLVKLHAMDSLTVTDAFAKRLRRIPLSLRKTLTYDRGAEMSLHQSLAKRLHIDIFFCDPYSPSQRATNENFNGLVREYLPKGMDLSLVTTDQLKFIEDKLNNRPRKILGFKTPNEVFAQLGLDRPDTVALQA